MEELEALLRCWGRAYGERPPQEWQEDRTLTGSHPLDRARMFARSKRDKIEMQAWTPTRAKALMKWAANGFAGRPPAWAGEIVTATETRTSGAKVMAQFDNVFTPQMALVESAAMDLYRLHPLRGAVLRGQYCRRGSQAEKAEWVAGVVGEEVPVRRFRGELEHARTWMHGRLAA